MKQQMASMVGRSIIAMDFHTWGSMKNLEKLTSGKFYLYRLVILNSTFHGVSCRITFLWIWSDLLYFLQLKEVQPILFYGRIVEFMFTISFTSYEQPIQLSHMPHSNTRGAYFESLARG